MKYISLCRLQLRRPYKILQVSEKNCHGNILLTLKAYGFMEEEEEFHSFLFSEFVPMFRKAVLQKAGKTTDLNLMYCGNTNYGGGRPIIKISGRGFTHYLV